MGITKLNIKNGIIQDKFIDGIPVKIDIVEPKGKRNVRTLVKMPEVIGVTNHNTGNSAPTATDTAHANWLQNVENADTLYVSPQIFVDHDSITQAIPIDEVGYHAGDGRGDGNYKTIAIEICQNANILKAEENAKKLNAALIMTYPHFKIYKHQDWSNKYCPRVILSTGRWSKFVRDINELVKGATVKPEAPESVINGDSVTISNDIYGYRTAADALKDNKRVKLVPKGTYPVMIHHESGAWNVGKGYLYWINPKELTASEQSKVYAVKSGDTLSEIAQDFGVTVDAIVKQNNIKDKGLIYVDQEIVIPSGKSEPAKIYHTVIWGDTVSELAVKYKTTTNKIKTLNNLKDVGKISVGQKLRVK